MDYYEELLFVFGKLTLAAVLGGAIGFERESHGQAAGFRTNILVGVGACLMMMLSLNMEEVFRALDSNSVVRLDPGRIASYAIASMGFLGAGAIIKGRGSVRGLTTAASLWLVTGIGLGVGAGFILPSVLATLISLAILYNLRHFRVYFARDLYTQLSLTFRLLPKPLAQVRRILAEYPEIKIQFINYQLNVASQTVTYRIRLFSKEHMPWGKIIRQIIQQEGLVEMAWEEGDVP